ncbi:MAG: hypothetical protein HYR67_08170 [Bacteroidetes bacterium]|nr:hypothetical protein [Bacteroidota bacterium]
MKIKNGVAILIILGIIPFFNLAAQEILTSNHLRPYSYEFIIDKNELKGDGAKLLLQKMENCQFVLIGENHSSSQLGKFVTTLIPNLSEFGFKNMSIETGPYSADKLMELSTVSSETLNRLKSFNKKYYNGKYPIVFFGGKEDALFLREARAKMFDLWGLDQEYGNSNEYLLDEMLLLTKGKNSYTEFEKMKRDAFASVNEIKKSGSASDCRLLKDPAILKYFNSFDSTDLRAQEIIAALKKSWEIYCLYEDEKYDENNKVRADYMKTNFMNKYKNAQSNGQRFPKVLVKMGHGHVTIGNSPLGVEDVGRMVRELAFANGTTSLHIAQRQRFWKTKVGLTVDFLKQSREISPVLELAKRDRWVIIDMQKFREAKKELIISKPMAQEIARYDILLLTPLDKRVKKNR